MKTFRQFCAAVVLTLALVLSALAGEIGTPGAKAPPPQSSMAGETQFPGAACTGDMSAPGVVALDPVTEAALSLLRSLLLLF